MPREIDAFEIVEPTPSPILESMRAFGYTTQTAIADLIDNSISAEASEVDVDFHWNQKDSWVTVRDNGWGMSEIVLVNAMRLGSRSPVEERRRGDLGRFGLGLKTASFSQCRELTVLTKVAGSDVENIRRWNLDEVRTSGEWRLMKKASIARRSELLGSIGDSGTLVVWEQLDRFLDQTNAEHPDQFTHDQFLKVVDGVASHLELVFHRFLSKTKPLQIRVNGRLLVPWDPFLRNHIATQLLGVESLTMYGDAMTVRPFVLPHRSKLSSKEHDDAAGITGWNSGQGFYVYREDRLLVAGSWLGVGGMKEEHTKLARISLDIPSTLDHLWQVDVKKASIRPPAGALKDLQRVAKWTRKQAQEVYRFRGKALTTRTSHVFASMWSGLKQRDGALRFRLNRKHPLVAEALVSGLPDRKSVERLLRIVEETVPLTQIGISLSDALDVPAVPFDAHSEEIREQLEYAFGRQLVRGRSADEALDYLRVAEPFNYYQSIFQAFEEGLK